MQASFMVKDSLFFVSRREKGGGFNISFYSFYFWGFILFYLLFLVICLRSFGVKGVHLIT